MEWHVSPTVQKLLDKIDYDWNIPYYTMSPELPTLYLEDSLFLDDSSLYSKIKVATWNWQEKSKCFPLIKTTNAPFISLDKHWQTSVKKDDEKKAQYPRRSIQKIALFDISSVSMGQTRQRTRNYSDYGKEVVPQDHHGSNNRSAISAAVIDGTDKQANGTAFHAATCSFLPHQEIDSFIKRKQQRINLKQGGDCQS
ncbi:hypothetical protein [Parasitella parasitica]|uniref:Uncharacterized protein n=1 Tax=Parasitella parasitica TaxID=35722 RepID=A0A0B7NJV1_9FUNG|nr:hypothetical protein [Parasitella parasitica]